MKKTRRIASLLLALVMVFGLSATAFAQTVAYTGEDAGSAAITISNAAKGETYKVVKLFDASVTGEEDGPIIYTGTIPEALAAYFETTASGTVLMKEDADEASAFAAMKTWAEGQTATASAESDGSELTFTSLPYGYYVITTTQGAAITVTSTNPTATVVDKNPGEPVITKVVDDQNVDIGQTVTYTLTAPTVNYLQNADGIYEIVTEYIIADTLPAFLKDVTVTSITIGGAAYTVDGEVPQFSNKQISIPWATQADENSKYVSLYKNKSEIVVTYTAVVTEPIVIDGNGNPNVVTLSAKTTPNEDTPPSPPDPWEETWKDDEVIYTYAAALQKVDENKKPLAGATFAAKGLTVTGSAGDYTVVSYDPDGTEYGTVMECDSEGQLVIKGLSTDSKLTVKEVAAPAGYNLLADTVIMTPVKTGEEVKTSSQTIYYDANGNVTDEVTETSYEKVTYNVDLLKTAVVVINNPGTELPSTGGMGTTLFYIVGGFMVLAAVVLLVTKKRMTMSE